MIQFERQDAKTPRKCSRSFPYVLSWRFGVLAFILFCCFPTGAEVPKTQANQMIELQFTTSIAHVDPFNDVTLDIIFIAPSGQQLRVPAFWAGKNVWKARYASPIVGEHRYRAESNDSDLAEVRGEIEIEKYTGANPLLVHGPLRVSSNRRYLEHLDGTPFFWLGD